MSQEWERYNLTPRQRAWVAYKAAMAEVPKSEFLRRTIDKLLESAPKGEIEAALKFAEDQQK